MNIKDIKPGSLVTFRSKNPNDTVVWRGSLESVGTYRSIRGYRDPSSYNEAVRQTDPTVSSNVQDLTYFLITVDNQSSLPNTQAFAEEWIVAGTLATIDLAKEVTIRVDDPQNNSQRILAILAEAGYTGRIISE